MRCLLFLCLLLTGCRAFDPQLLAPTPGVLAPRLPPAVPVANTDWIVQLTAPGFGAAGPHGGSRDVNALFEREVREALAEPYGPPRCLLRLSTTIIDHRQGLGWAFASGLTMGGFNLLGMPYSRHRIQVSAKLEVFDSQRQLAGAYTTQAEARALGSLYSRTNYAQPSRVVYLQAVRQGLQQLKQQVQADLPRLQAVLQASGPVVGPAISPATNPAAPLTPAPAAPTH